MTANSNNIEITRRTFLEVVFATTIKSAEVMDLISDFIVKPSGVE